MAQLRRLRQHLDAQERVFTTVQGLADFVVSLGPTRGNTCAVRLCFFRGDHFTTDHYSETHLEFIDAESALAFEEARRMLLAMPLNLVGREICRLTVWERTDLAYFTPGVVNEIRHVFNFNVYNKMPQASMTRACAEDRVEMRPVSAGDDGPFTGGSHIDGAAPASGAIHLATVVRAPVDVTGDATPDARVPPATLAATGAVHGPAKSSKVSTVGPAAESVASTESGSTLAGSGAPAHTTPPALSSPDAIQPTGTGSPRTKRHRAAKQGTNVRTKRAPRTETTSG